MPTPLQASYGLGPAKKLLHPLVGLLTDTLPHPFRCVPVQTRHLYAVLASPASCRALLRAGSDETPALVGSVRTHHLNPHPRLQHLQQSYLLQHHQRLRLRTRIIYAEIRHTARAGCPSTRVLQKTAKLPFRTPYGTAHPPDWSCSGRWCSGPRPT